MDINGPPGIIHPLLQENYAWVDECLREKYYNNFDKWVDKESYENYLSLLKPTPITWANYKSRTILKCIENEDTDDHESFITYENRNHTESDISNYEVNVGKVILNAYSNSLSDNQFIEEYYFEEVFTTNYNYESDKSQESQESQESYYSYDSY